MAAGSQASCGGVIEITVWKRTGDDNWTKEGHKKSVTWEGVGRNGHNLRATWRPLGGESEKGKGMWSSEDSGQVRVETVFRIGGGKAEALRCPRWCHEALPCQVPGYWPPWQDQCEFPSGYALLCSVRHRIEAVEGHLGIVRF